MRCSPAGRSTSSRPATTSGQASPNGRPLFTPAPGPRPPQTGGDNPAHYDDGAASRAVAVGIRFAGHTGLAADVARNLAEITHAEDGVWAAEAMAATIAAAVGGSTLPEAVDA